MSDRISKMSIYIRNLIYRQSLSFSSYVGNTKYVLASLQSIFPFNHFLKIMSQFFVSA